MQSAHNPDPAMYSDGEWIASTYTVDGQTIFALIHNEYQGHKHPGQCPQNDYFPCWDNSLTLGISSDGGRSYAPALPPPAHLVARFPYPYEAGAGPEGFRSPSNMIAGPDGYIYAYFNVSEYGTQEQWVCLMRTNDLADPRSWRFWDGAGFDGQFANPYQDEISDPQQHICPPLAWDEIGASLNDSITYNNYLERFVLIGISADWLDGREVWGFYYAFSESINFDTTSQTAYPYFTRNNFGHASLDRDLIRIPVAFYPSPQDAAATP